MSDLHPIPRTWQWVTLKDIAEVVTGNTPPTSDVENYGGEVPFFKPPQLNDLSVSKAPETLSARGLNKARLLPPKAVLVSCIGILGKTAITKTTSTTNQQINAIIFESSVLPEYGFYYSQTLSPWLQEHSSATTVAIINKGKFETAPFPVPPLAEQTRIVAKLEELLSDLDAGVAELKAAQKKLAQYRQSLLKAAVEGALTADWRAKNTPTETGAQLLERILQERRARWEAKQLAKFESQGKAPPKGWQAKYPEPVQLDITNLPALPQGWVWASVDQCSLDESAITDGPFGSNLKSSHYQDFGPRVIRLQNIGDGVFVDARAHISESHYSELLKHAVQEDDLVIAMLGEVLPRACIIPNGVTPAIVKADCARVRVNKGLMEPSLLVAQLNSKPVRDAVVKFVKGIGRPRVNLAHIRAIPIALSSMEEQLQVEALLSDAQQSIDQQNQTIELSLKHSNAQRQNILRAAFAGQLVPQDPNDEPASVLLERIRTERTARDAVKKPRGRKPKEPA